MRLPCGFDTAKRFCGFSESPQMSGIAQRRKRGVFRVSGQSGLEISSLLIEFEVRRRGSVGFHCRKHFRQSRKAALGELQFLEELSDAAIPRWYGRDPGCRCQVLEINSRNRAGVADDLNPAGIEVNLGGFRLIDIVTPMIHRVHERLAQRWQGIADPPLHLALVWLLLQMDSREVLQVVQTVSQLVCQSTAKDALFLHIPCSVRSEMHDFDVGTPEPAFRISREEEEADVSRHFVIVDRYCDAQPPVNLRRARLVQQSTSNVAQILAYLSLSKIADSCVLRPAIIPRHACRLFDKPSQQVSALFGIDGIGTEADPIPEPTTRTGRTVWPHFTSRHPHHQNTLARNRFR